MNNKWTINPKSMVFIEPAHGIKEGEYYACYTWVGPGQDDKCLECCFKWKCIFISKPQNLHVFRYEQEEHKSFKDMFNKHYLEKY